MSYQQLIQDKRYPIGRLLKEGWSFRAVASLIGCHHNTLARERRRNRDEMDHYRAAHAYLRAVMGTPPHSQPTSAHDAATWAVVEQYLREDWLREAIVGRGVVKVSVERIYHYVASNTAAGGDP